MRPRSDRDLEARGAVGAPRALRAVSVGAGLAVVAIGLAVIAGWIFDVAALKRLAPGLASMKFNTAVCLTLLGAAVAIGPRTRWAKVASAVTALVAGASLAQYAVGRDFGIDEAFFHDVAFRHGYPGRMAISTGTCLLLGAATLQAQRLGRAQRATLLAAPMLLIGWLGCLGYVFGVRALYDVGPFSSMAGHTAVAVTLLAVALFAANDEGPLPRLVRGDDPGSTVLRRILPLAFVGMPFVAYLERAGQRADWFAPVFGLVILVVSASTGIVAVAVYCARAVNHSHDAWVGTNEELRDLNAHLEETVAERTMTLALTEARAQALAGAAPIGIFRTDASGQRTYVNDRYCEIYGRSREELLGQMPGGGIHEDDQVRVMASWHAAVKIGGASDLTFRIRRPSGAVAWVHAHAAEVPGFANGDRVGSMEDITARREAERALREAEELFRTTFESSPVGLALIDDHGFVVSANRAVRALTGRSQEELVTMRLQSILRTDEAAPDERRAHTTNADQRIVRADGSVSWASIRYARMEHAGGGAYDERDLTVVQFVDTTERRDFEDRLVHMANHDPLSGLMNRRSFEAALENHVAHCKRYGPDGAVLMLDLDHFKQINDTHGHSTGDQVIVATALGLRQRLRESDLIARMGGDEFVVLLPKCSPADARRVAQSLVDHIHDAAGEVHGGRIALSASVGVAVFDEVDRSPDEMLVNADLAMYDAKERGRDTWAEYATAKYDGPRSKARLTWINRIEDAIDNDRFALYAQPVVDLTTGEQVQLEVVVRMLTEQGDVIPSGTLLEVAERYGLISRIDSWVLRHVLDRLQRSFGRKGTTRLAVRLSSLSLGDNQLLEMIEARVRGGQLTPDQLVLGISETAAVTNIAALVTNCLTDRTDQAIIGGLVNLARTLGKETIAQGIVDDDGHRYLRKCGVDYGQSDYLGAPVALDVAILARTPTKGSVGTSRADSTMW